MALKVGEVFAELRVDKGSFDKDIDRSVKDLDRVEDGAGRTEGAMRSLGGMFRSVAGDVAKMAAGFIVAEVGMRAVGAVGGFIKDSFIGMNSTLEQNTIAFTTLLGSASAADTFLRDLGQFAATTPFEFPELLDASKRMLAFGFASGEVLPILTDVGNVAAGLGVGAEGIDRITMAIGQMTAKGKVQTEELLQLTELGIPALQILADATGKSTAEIQEMVSAGQVSSDVFLRAFQIWSQANFGGMMEAQSKTFDGAMSNIVDTLRMGIADGLRPWFEALSSGAQRLAEFLSTDRFQQWVQTLSDLSSQAIDALLSIPDTASAFSGWVQAVFADGDLLNDYLSQLPSWFQQMASHVEAMLSIGGNNAIAAYAQGIIDGADSYVTTAVNYVADLVAAYLVGQSPPKEGPLSRIVEGGMAITEAWVAGALQGMGGVAEISQFAADSLARVNEGMSLDEGRAALEEGAGSLEAIQDLSENVAEEIDQINRALEEGNIELDKINDQIDDVNRKYDDQIGVLEEQVDLLKNARDFTEERADLELDLAQNAAKTAQIQALGDPALQAEIDAKLELLDMEQDALDLAERRQETEDKLAGKLPELTDEERERLEIEAERLEMRRKDLEAQLKGEGKLSDLQKDRIENEIKGLQQKLKADDLDPIKEEELRLKIKQLQEKLASDGKLTAEERKKIELDLRDLALQEAQVQDQLAGKAEDLTEEERKRLELELEEIKLLEERQKLIDEEALAQANKDAAILDAQEQQRDLAQERHDIENAIIALPIEQKIADLEKAREAELEPLEKQQQILQDHLAELQDQRAEWQLLQGDVERVLGPLEEARRLQEQAAQEAERNAKAAERAASAAEREAAAAQKKLEARQKDNSFEASQARLRGELTCPPGWIMDEFGRCFNPDEEAWKEAIKEKEQAEKEADQPMLELPPLPEEQGVEVPVVLKPGEDMLSEDMIREEAPSLGERFGLQMAEGLLKGLGQLLKDNAGKVVGGALGAGIGSLIGAPLGLSAPFGLLGGAIGGLIGSSLQSALEERGIDLDGIVEGLRTTFEEEIQPTLETFAGFVTETLMPPLERFFGFLQEHQGTIAQVAMVVGGFVAAFLTISTVVGWVAGLAAAISGFVTVLSVLLSGGMLPLLIGLLGTLLSPVVLIAGAVALLALAWTKNWGDIQGKAKAAWDFVGPLLQALWDRIQRFADVIGPELVETWQAIERYAQTIWGGVKAVVTPVIEFISKLISDHSTEIMGVLTFAWDVISNVVDTALGIISNVIQLVLNLIQGDWDEAWENVKNIFEIAWEGIKEGLRLARTAIDTLIGEFLPKLQEKLGEWGMAFVQWIIDTTPELLKKAGVLLADLGTWIVDTAAPKLVEKLKEWGAAFLNWIADEALPYIGEKLGALLSAITDWIGDSASGATSTLKKKLGEFASAFLDWIKEDVLGEGGEKLKGRLGAILTTIKNWVTEKLETLKGYGASIGKGIGDGIEEAIKLAVNAAIGIVNTIIDAWNALEFKIPDIDLPGPVPDVPGFGVGTPDISKIPELAQGGIVRRPTLAIVGEGPETEVVQPLSQLQSLLDMQRGPTNLTAYIQSPWDPRDVRQVVLQIVNDEIGRRR